MSTRILTGDCREVLRSLPDGSVHCVVTSPPYYGLRDYGTGEWVGADPDCDHRKVTDPNAGTRKSGLEGEKKTNGHQQEGYLDICGKCGALRVDRQIGLERTPAEYVAQLVEVFREVRRVLRDDGTVWLNLGDSYATGAGSVGARPGGGAQGDRWAGNRGTHTAANSGKDRPRLDAMGPMTQPNRMPLPGLKPKDLIGIPWRVAFALQEDGWWLRSDIIWAKPNPMPESVMDRPTRAHEYVFLLSKSERYFYDAAAVAEEGESGPSDLRKMEESLPRIGGKHKTLDDPLSKASAATNIGQKRSVGTPGVRNRRTVWRIATAPFPGAHFATFPPDLVEPCIKAGSPLGGVVLDPFGGSGTVGLVADRLGRDAVLVELNPAYADMARRRIENDAGLFAQVAAQ